MQMQITWTGELILITILLACIIILQLIPIIFKKKDEISPVIKELGEFKSSIIDIVNVKFSDLLKENRENEKFLREAITKTLDSLYNSIKKNEISCGWKITKNTEWETLRVV